MPECVWSGGVLGYRPPARDHVLPGIYTRCFSCTRGRLWHGQASLIGMVEGRCESSVWTWFAARPQSWRERIEIMTMGGFSGHKSATSEEVPQAVTVINPFHVVKLDAPISEPTGKGAIPQEMRRLEHLRGNALG